MKKPKGNILLLDVEGILAYTNINHEDYLNTLLCDIATVGISFKVMVADPPTGNVVEVPGISKVVGLTLTGNRPIVSAPNEVCIISTKENAEKYFKQYLTKSNLVKLDPNLALTKEVSVQAISVFKGISKEKADTELSFFTDLIHGVHGNVTLN